MPESVVNHQSPYTAQSLLDHIASATPTTAVCWKVTPHATSPLAASGFTLAATSYDRPLSGLPGHAGVTFKPKFAGIPTTIDTEAGHGSGGLSYDTVFHDDGITRDILAAGDLNRAKVEIFTANYKALAMGQLIEYTGFIGRTDEEGDLWRAEVRPLTSIAQAQVGRLTGARCDVKRLGDARCTVNLNAPSAGDGLAIKVTGTLSAVVAATRVRASALSQGTDYFELLKFTSGALAGREYEVREFDAVNKEFILRHAMHRLPSVGDAFTATRRCNRDPVDCRAKFANIINYRGHRFITNVEAINKIERAT